MNPPGISGLLESALYVADLQQSISFYETVFRFPVLFADHRMCAMAAGPAQVLLLFLKGASAKASQLPGGIVPGSDGAGHLHLAFGILQETLADWQAWLGECGVAIESTVSWPAGTTSVYFRDPDGHVLEVATPGLWANY